MKRFYSTPSVTEQPIRQLCALCGSDRVSSNIGVGGGDQPGDVTDAF